MRHFISDILNCKICARFPCSGSIIVPGRGNLAAKMVIVGEAAGETEEKLGRPFVGRAGKLLEKVLANLGIDSEKDVYITNLIKTRCIIKSGKQIRNTPPRAAQAAHGFTHLKQEIDAIQPELIVTLGSSAAQAFLGRNFSITKEHGRVFTWQKKRILPTYHPSYVTQMSGPKNPKVLNEFIGDLRKAKRLLLKF